jgi:hypothetical protein
VSTGGKFTINDQELSCKNGFSKQVGKRLYDSGAPAWWLFTSVDAEASIVKKLEFQQPECHSSSGTLVEKHRAESHNASCPICSVFIRLKFPVLSWDRIRAASGENPKLKTSERMVRRQGFAAHARESITDQFPLPAI